MSLRLTTCGLPALGRTIQQTNPDEVLSVLPRFEGHTSGPFAWPPINIPHTVVEVSDLGYGDLFSEEDLAEIVAADPDQIPPSPAHVETIIAVGRRALANANIQD